MAQKVHLLVRAARADTTAGKSMDSRFGTGEKMKTFLYMQDLIANGLLKILKMNANGIVPTFLPSMFRLRH